MKIYNINCSGNKIVVVATNNADMIIKIIDSTYLEHTVKVGDYIHNSTVNKHVQKEYSSLKNGYWGGILQITSELSLEDFKEENPEYFL